jgi:hypothetical protein
MTKDMFDLSNPAVRRNAYGLGFLATLVTAAVLSINPPQYETTTVREAFLNPEAHENTEITYAIKHGTDIILPINLVTAIGSTRTYGDAQFPREISIGGDHQITGYGWDYDEDGKLDDIKKQNPTAPFSFSELETELYRVRSMAATNPDRVYAERVTVSD